MQAYLPSAWFVPVLVLAIVAVTVAGGRALTRHASLRVVRLAGWSSLVIGSAAIERALAAEPPGVRMLSLIAFAMVVLKALVIGEARARGVPLLGPLRFLAFTLAWPGMRPELFVAKTAVPEGQTAALFRRGALQLALGALSLVAARALWDDNRSELLTTSLLLVGISLALHFGLLSLLAAGFRLAGIACEALFRAPLLSESLSEFWSRRWNIAFSEMTALVDLSAARGALRARAGAGRRLRAVGFPARARDQRAGARGLRIALCVLCAARAGGVDRALATARGPARLGLGRARVDSGVGDPAAATSLPRALRGRRALAAARRVALNAPRRRA